MISSDDSITVEIYDHPYHLRAGADPGYVQKLAETLDEKMREIADATQTVDSLKVAVLAALTIADEVTRLRKENAELAAMLSDKVESCIKALDSVLQQSR